MKRYLVLLLPLLALGCISGGGGGDAMGTCTPDDVSGVVIQLFQPDVPSILVGEDIVFLMKVENMGDAQATGTEAEITSLGGLTKKAGESLVQSLGDLEEHVEGIEAPAVTEWELKAPADLGTLESQTINVKARLSYDYVSSGQADVVFIPNDEWRQRQKSGDTAIDAGVQCSNAPISVSVIAQNPLRADPEGDGATSVRFTIRNDGDGIIKSIDGDLDVIDSIRVDISDLSSDFEPTADCDFDYDDASRVLLAEDLKLINGQKTLSCKFSLVDAPIRETRFPMVANVRYRYFQESEATVMVEAISTYTELNLGKDDAVDLYAGGTGYVKSIKVAGTPYNFNFMAKRMDGAAPINVDGTSTTAWQIQDTDEYLVVVAHASFNGITSNETFSNTGIWSASIRNENTKSYPLTVHKVLEADDVLSTASPDINADNLGPFLIYLDFPQGEGWPASTSSIYSTTDPATLTIGFTYQGKSASGTITNLYLSSAST
ncbi:MAG: hypothetical protein ABH829_05315 [archaeon]